MNLPVRKGLLGLCVALLGVGGLVRLGIDFSERYTGAAHQKTQLEIKLAHLKGWVSVSDQVGNQAQALFGGSSENEGVLEQVSRQARSLGLRIFELKPSENAAELAMEGTATQIGSYLQGLSQHRPPLKIEAVQMISQPKTEAPVTLRIRLEWLVPAGAQK